MLLLLKFLQIALQCFLFFLKHPEHTQIVQCTGKMSAYIGKKRYGNTWISQIRIIQTDKTAQLRICKQRQSQQRINILNLQDVIFRRHGFAYFLQLMDNYGFSAEKLLMPHRHTGNRNMNQIVNLRDDPFPAPFKGITVIVLFFGYQFKNIDPVCICIFTDILKQCRDTVLHFFLIRCLIDV